MLSNQGWSGEPNTRGTFDILWNCVSTLALCVWTAVHPNILPVPSFRKAFLSRLRMMLIAIVFPEVIISAAWRQLRLEHWLRMKINARHYLPSVKHHRRSPSAKEPPLSDYQGVRQTMLPTFDFEHGSSNASLHLGKTSQSATSSAEEGFQEKKSGDEVAKGTGRWTSEQSFFAVMGGFAIEIAYINPTTRLKTTVRRLVTVEGVLQLFELELIPPISPEDIEERSKSDLIAKLYVLSQITWFGLQVIGRLATNIPVTPLEIHTAIHVACTIAIFIMWLKKPYDVRSSVLLTDPKARDMGALFNFFKIQGELHARAHTKYESAREEYWKDRAVRAANNVLDHDPPPLPPVREALTKAVERYSQLQSEEMLATTEDAKDEYILTTLAPAALRGIEKLRKSKSASDAFINAQNWNFLRSTSENLTIKEVWGGWSTNTGHEMSLDKAVHFLFNLLYGGCHLAAWSSSSFPSEAERWLWRGSGIMLAAVPIWGSLWVLWWKAARSKRGALCPIRNGDLDIFAAPFFFVVILAYFVARSYLLVESLISLRLLPKGAFLTVNWATIFAT